MRHEISPSDLALLHPLCDTEEFGLLVRLAAAVVRRKIRRGEIVAHGRPAKINIKEAVKFGVSLEDARLMLPIIRRAAIAPMQEAA